MCMEQHARSSALFEFRCFSKIDCHDLVIADRRHFGGQTVTVLGDGKVSLRDKKVNFSRLDSFRQPDDDRSWLCSRPREKARPVMPAFPLVHLQKRYLKASSQRQTQ